ncbi:hypothetical protein NFI96_011529, partial [Prochilodus magdalenae]
CCSGLPDVQTMSPWISPCGEPIIERGLKISDKGVLQHWLGHTYSFDPCHSYTVLDDEWRSTSYSYSYSFWYSNNRGHDDTTVEWNGWYRLFFQGADAQILEVCVSYVQCGGFPSLWLDKSHPQIDEGIVTREVYASRIDESYWSWCDNHRKSNPIQVKALFVSITVTFPKLSYDPCYNYEVLDDPDRAINQTRNWRRCDTNINWSGWYCLLYEGNNIRMPESCVSEGICSTDIPLWLNGSHRRLEVVIRQVCGSWNGDCCYFKSLPIRVKACPGNYYVYEFVSPNYCSSAYCADVNTITPVNDPEIPGTRKSTTTTSTTGTNTTCHVFKNICSVFDASSVLQQEKQKLTTDGVLQTAGDVHSLSKAAVSKSVHSVTTVLLHHALFISDSRETCENSSGTMSLSRCQLLEAGFPTNVLHLSDAKKLSMARSQNRADTVVATL